MTWKVRHQGSPQAVSGLSLPQVIEGLQDGQWEPTDEVMGPQDRDWTVIENHPQLAEIAAEIELPPPKVYDDETRLDMNALIDVCLVLLIFFILTTTYAVLQKRLEAPGTTGKSGPLVVTRDKLESETVPVKIKLENGQPVIYIGKAPVDRDSLLAELRRYKGQSGKTTLSLEIDDDVEHEVETYVLDQAKGAGLDQVQMVTPTQ
jgi:biopolymer transport protein ExbD